MTLSTTRALAVAAAVVWLNACTLLYQASGASSKEEDASLADSSVGNDDGPNLDDYRIPYACDEHTIVLLHFDSSPWNSSDCRSCLAFEEGETLERDGPSTEFGLGRGVTGTAFLSINNSCLQPVTQFSVEAWVRPDLISGDRYIAFLGEGQTVWSLHLDDEGYAVAAKGDESCSPVDTVRTTREVVIGRWHHLRLTYDGEVLRLFLDGLEEDSVRATSTAFCAFDTAPLYLGVRGGGSNPLVGSIDEFRYSSTARK